MFKSATLLIALFAAGQTPAILSDTTAGTGVVAVETAPQTATPHFFETPQAAKSRPSCCRCVGSGCTTNACKSSGCASSSCPGHCCQTLCGPVFGGHLSCIWGPAIEYWHTPFCCNHPVICDFLHDPGNFHQHLPYRPPALGYYYFRPYNYQHVPQHQAFVGAYGGDPRNPYSNKIFDQIDRVMAQRFRSRQPAEVNPLPMGEPLVTPPAVTPDAASPSDRDPATGAPVAPEPMPSAPSPMPATPKPATPAPATPMPAAPMPATPTPMGTIDLPGPPMPPVSPQPSATPTPISEEDLPPLKPMDNPLRKSD